MPTVRSILVLAQQAPAPSPVHPNDSVVATVWDMAVKGGWVMVPLALCSLVAMTIIVERLVVTRRGRVVPPALLGALAGLRHRPREALARCTGHPSPLAFIMTAAIRAHGAPRPEQERRMAEAGQREARRFRQRMRLLSALPQTATMLGLLGTVVGMIRTFTVVAASGESLGRTERLAQGIYEAWTATAAGLAIAIPTLLAYHIILGRIDGAIAALDHAATLWLDGDPEQPAEATGAPAANTAAQVQVSPHVQLAAANGAPA